MSKQFDVLIGEDYQTREGEKKTAWTNVGHAWVKDNGSISIKIRGGLSVGGSLLLVEPREKDQNATSRYGASGAGNSAKHRTDPDDSIPF